MSEDINRMIADWSGGWEFFLDEAYPHWKYDGKIYMGGCKFTESLDACSLFEDEIEKRGLWDKYQWALFKQWEHTDLCNQMDSDRFFIRATEAQRCKALLEVIDNA